MDLLTAHRLVIGTQESLNNCVRGFDEVKRAADAFVDWANAKMQEKKDCEVVVQAVLPEKRVRRKKAMPGELAEDEPVSDAEADYRIKYNLLTDAYHVIGLSYKFLLTLSFSQVACERTFSTLKYVKNRLRTTLTLEHMEAFMLMCTEKEILMALDTDGVIDRVAETNELLRHLLVM
ncbi:hypothetical protein JOQ06_023301 [Pogonophryne albipinna]|uniref:HAT C-terminal dimerisation domain-containing protein n=1 Tax=Pogonophryne albipinna TaxID=1090488 RepID=A0AAD6FSP2_9TELE|nr:hypothetical protein JOQ06_023301 [Pogonophryne albipinna]